MEAEGVENVPAEGGALLVSNHSGALPPDAPMIMQAIRHEHPAPRPLYMLAEHWFKGYPGVGLLTNKIGVVPAHPANAQRLLARRAAPGARVPRGPEGQRASSTGSATSCAASAAAASCAPRCAPVCRSCPIAVVGAEDAMPIFAHVPFMQRLTGLIYFPVNHAFPHFGLAAALMYLPAKFKIRFLEPIDLSHLRARGRGGSGPRPVDRRGRPRAASRTELDSLVASRTSVWFG